jgi:hypothetical protein
VDNLQLSFQISASEKFLLAGVHRLKLRPSGDADSVAFIKIQILAYK